ncbi:MAG: hypothetical protein ABEJ43_06310 [Haloferacaceae archaeon]
MASTTPTGGRLRTDSLTGLHGVGIALALLSGVIHLVLGVAGLPSALGISFVLAAGGFFGAVVLVLLDYRRRLVYLAGIPFVAVQFVLYFALNWPNVWNPGGMVDKVAQAALMVVLVVLYRRS